MPSRICRGGAAATSTSCRNVKISGSAGGTTPRSTAISICWLKSLLSLQIISVGKRRTLLIVMAFVGLAILFAVLLPHDDEPRYKGQTLGEWVKAHDYARSGT